MAKTKNTKAKQVTAAATKPTLEFTKKLAVLKTILEKEDAKKYKTVFCIMFVIALLLEVFVFNLSFTLSLFNKNVPVQNISVVSGNQNGTYEYKATSDDGIVLEIKNINSKVNNIHLDFTTNSPKTNVAFAMQDEGNKSYYTSAERTILNSVKRSQYVRLHPAGKLNSLRIEIKASNNQTISLNDLKLNVHVPLMFSIVRFLFVLMIMFILYLLRPGSFVYKYKINFKSTKQQFLILILVMVQVITYLSIANLNPFFKSPTRHYYDQYHELTESILAGHTYLIQHDVSDNLKNMENPYDLQERVNVLSRDNGGHPWDYEWDHAYFNGRVYVYFGIAPVIFMYIPFYLISGGHHLPDHMAIWFISLLLIIGVLFMLYQIIKKWFKNTPLVLYLLMSCLFVNSCGIVYALQRPDLYSVPVTMSVMFGVFGIGFWIAALKEDKKTGKEKISTPLLAIGSACVACTAGCRPQTLCIIIIGIILYWDSVFKNRLLFSKNTIKQTSALVIPFVVVAAALMAYNAVRFGSPFDFGANYNLTNNDMRYRGFNIDRALSAIHYFLFAPVVVQGGFPFVNRTNIEIAYQGKTIAESMFGAFPANPILWVCFAVFALRTKFADRRLYKITITSMILALILAVLAGEVAAIYLRYLTDFSWLLLLAASIIVFLINDMVKSDYGKRWFTAIFMICFVLGMTFHGLWIFTDISDNLKDLIPKFWYSVQHLVAFWL